MSKKQKQHAKNNAPYLTMGRCVYLGRANKRVRSNAKSAGLVVVDAKAMRKLISSMMAMQRIVSQGEWHDTVKY